MDLLVWSTITLTFCIWGYVFYKAASDKWETWSDSLYPTATPPPPSPRQKTCGYCGTKHLEFRCPSCGAPNQK